MLRIRQATIEDEGNIFTLFQQLPSRQAGVSPAHQQRCITIFREVVNNDGKGTILVAEEDGTMLGVITLSYPTAIRCGGIYTSIEEFVVSEQARGKGIGSKLLEAAIAAATARGCYEVHVGNPSTLGYPLYIKQGLQDNDKHLKMRLSDTEQ
ncbi:MAG: GNAT family N-acetyltransferase [Dehalococcoidales bacterium]|nr:GNAT family N-acetyltransferase [Dehalococcoidales bacterium]